MRNNRKPEEKSTTTPKNTSHPPAKGKNWQKGAKGKKVMSVGKQDEGQEAQMHSYRIEGIPDSKVAYVNAFNDCYPEEATHWVKIDK